MAMAAVRDWLARLRLTHLAEAMAEEGWDDMQALEDQRRAAVEAYNRDSTRYKKGLAMVPTISSLT